MSNLLVQLTPTEALAYPNLSYLVQGTYVTSLAYVDSQELALSLTPTETQPVRDIIDSAQFFLVEPGETYTVFIDINLDTSFLFDGAEVSFFAPSSVILSVHNSSIDFPEIADGMTATYISQNLGDLVRQADFLNEASPVIIDIQDSVTAESNTRAAADVALQADIDTKADQTDLDTEIADRIAGNNALTLAIGTKANQTALTAETNARIAADAGLASSIATLTTTVEGIGERYQVANVAEMTASPAPDGSTFFVIDDGDGKWAQYQRIQGSDIKTLDQDDLIGALENLTSTQVNDPASTVFGLVNGSLINGAITLTTDPINADIQALELALDGKLDISVANTTFTNLENADDALQTQITSLEGDVSTIVTDVNNIVSDYETADQNLQDQIDLKLNILDPVLPQYPNTRDDGLTSRALFTDASGNLRHGPIRNLPSNIRHFGFDIVGSVSQTIYQDDFIVIGWNGPNRQPTYLLKDPTPTVGWGQVCFSNMTILGSTSTVNGNSTVRSTSGRSPQALNTTRYFSRPGSMNPAYVLNNYGGICRVSLARELYNPSVPSYFATFFGATISHVIVKIEVVN
jgi:hypothetical protein